MLFYSLNHQAPEVNFEQALLTGLAPDGGLYYPKTFPHFSSHELKSLPRYSLPQIGFKVLQKWLGRELGSDQLKLVSNHSLSFPIPLKKVGPYFVLELFHGPTLAFKDVAAKCLPQLLSCFLKHRHQSTTILTATSGDTGGAVAQGFAQATHIKVIILFPKGKVSRLQQEQLTRVASNIFPVEVEGVFDDCQTLVKRAFIDPDLSQLNLTSANSINIGRLLPQIIYYFHAWAQLPQHNLEFVVPSGNMGNITAGLFAHKMGLPVQSFILACNANDPVVNYYHTGTYQPQSATPTLSTAMDIGNPSNFARILEYFNHNHNHFRQLVKAVSIDDKTTTNTIKKVYQSHGYLLDPHTAVAWSAAEKLNNSKLTPVILATASPVKFATEIKQATGIKVDDSQAFKPLKPWRKRKYPMDNDYQQFTQLLVQILT